MGLLEQLFGGLDYADNHTVRGTNGKHRFVVNYVAINGTPSAAEVLAYSSGQALDAVRCRSDVKYTTSVYEL